ncbi:MAG: RNA-binding protein [Alphaproteobacteria bacterium CG_4_10_14_0_8_um_filter_53_9]|nr:MAG: RNA-binding protein [Alphaproteobacteria bacterium CG_4_10_14_0_8_um_filter_53_9]
MAVHELHLHEGPFGKILRGEKHCESRLFDEKRQKIRVGDEIVFISRDDGQEIRACVTALVRAARFAALYPCLPEAVREQEIEDDFLAELRRYYTVDDELRWGVLGIVFERVGL